jgi:hypothetical protein
MASNWFETRMRLNHDVLQNKVINAFVSHPLDYDWGTRLAPYLRLFAAQHGEFKSFLRAGSRDLRLGSWLADQMRGRIDSEALSALESFVNLDFDRTSSLPRRLLEIEALLELAKDAAISALHIEDASYEKLCEAERLIRQLSVALSSLPSSMTDVAETRR